MPRDKGHLHTILFLWERISSENSHVWFQSGIGFWNTFQTRHTYVLFVNPILPLLCLNLHQYQYILNIPYRRLFCECNHHMTLLFCIEFVFQKSRAIARVNSVQHGLPWSILFRSQCFFPLITLQNIRNHTQTVRNQGQRQGITAEFGTNVVKT